MAAAPGSGRQGVLVGVGPGTEAVQELVEFFFALLDLGLIVAIGGQGLPEREEVLPSPRAGQGLGHMLHVEGGHLSQGGLMAQHRAYGCHRFGRVEGAAEQTHGVQIMEPFTVRDELEERRDGAQVGRRSVCRDG